MEGHNRLQAETSLTPFLPEANLDVTSVFIGTTRHLGGENLPLLDSFPTTQEPSGEFF